MRESITLVLRRWQKLRVAPGWEILRERFIVLMKGDIETALRSLGMLKGLPAAQEHLASCGGWPEDLGPAPEWLGPPPPPEPTVQ